MHHYGDNGRDDCKRFAMSCIPLVPVAKVLLKALRNVPLGAKKRKSNAITAATRTTYSTVLCPFLFLRNFTIDVPPEIILGLLSVELLLNEFLLDLLLGRL